MFSIGFWEIVLLCAVALVLVKPRDIPAVMRKIGRFIGRVQSFREDLKRVAKEIERHVEESEEDDTLKENVTPEPRTTESVEKLR